MTAHGAHASSVDKDDAKIAPFVYRRRKEAAVHVIVSTWLKDRQSSEIVKMLCCIAPFFFHGTADDLRKAARDKPKWFSRYVKVQIFQRFHLEFNLRSNAFPFCCFTDIFCCYKVHQRHAHSFKDDRI